VRNIEEEAAAARRRREEEQRERERTQAMNAEMQRLRLEADEARANGDDRKAKEIEEEIRLMRELEEIRRTEGIDDAERARREEQARRISEARQRAIEVEEGAKRAREQGAGAGARASSETFGIEAGIAKTDALMRQVMGQRDPDAARWDKQTSQIDRIIDYLRQNEDRARSRPMLMLQ
jgi:colicin import membrane protein